MDDIDPYEELRVLMRDLAARGVPNDQIIDAAFRLAVGAACRTYGPQAAVDSLHDMIGLVTDESVPISRRLH